MGIFRKEKLGNGCRAVHLGGWRICYYKRNANRKDRFRNCDISPLASIDGETEIGNDVWIGTESIIRRGVHVGNFAVIGANSFVNKDVPDFAVAVGSPARVGVCASTRRRVGRLPPASIG